MNASSSADHADENDRPMAALKNLKEPVRIDSLGPQLHYPNLAGRKNFVEDF